MTDQEYVEGLAKVLCREACKSLGIDYDENYIEDVYKNWIPTAQAIADWHPEQGLMVCENPMMHREVTR